MIVSSVLLVLIISLWVVGRRYDKYAFFISNLIIIISIVSILQFYGSIEYPQMAYDPADPNWSPRTISDEGLIALYNFQRVFTICLTIPLGFYLIYFWVNVKKFVVNSKHKGD